jgi:hypothetical protein
LWAADKQWRKRGKVKARAPGAESGNDILRRASADPPYAGKFD